MKKADLINEIAMRMSIHHGRPVSRADAEALLESLGCVTARAMANGAEVTLPGLGKFSTRARGERQGRNPQTGEPITIPAATVPKFKPLSALKAALNPIQF